MVFFNLISRIKFFLNHVFFGAFSSPGTDRGCVYLWSDRGEKIASWQPHGTPVGAVKTRGRLTLSVSDLVCVYNEKDKSWQVSAWTEAELTAAEWVTDRQVLVADSLGCITMDSAEENQFMPVRGRKATKKNLKQN